MGIRNPTLDTTNSTSSMFPFRSLRERGRAHQHQKLSAEENIDHINKLKHCASNSSNNSRNFRAFFRGFSNNNKNNINSKRRNGNEKRRQRQRNPNSLSNVRKSTSTYLTENTNRSSAFMMIDPLVEPMTMSDFLMAEELAAFHANDDENGNGEERKQEEEEFKKEDKIFYCEIVDTASDASFTEKTSKEYYEKPLHQRIPPPESYYEMKWNERVELGKIQFEFESLDDAQIESARRKRPILCIEAETPGDITAGEIVFSHPLIVETAESLFVSVCRRPESQNYIDDDLGVTDERQRFFTNSSCRTRVRILDDRGVDVLPPVEHISAVEVIAAMIHGLEKYCYQVPKYLRLLLEEESGKLQVLSKTRFREIQGQAVFGVFDTAMAEVEFAELHGVIATRSGALVRQPVVHVTYDSRRLSYCALVRHALCQVKANIIYHQSNEERIVAKLEIQQFEESRAMKEKMYGSKSIDDEGGEVVTFPAIKVTEFFGNMRTIQNTKPALRGSVLRFVPLTDLQATKANRLIHLEKFNEAMHLLSPRQGLIAMQALRAHHSRCFRDVVDVPIVTAWNELCEDETSGPLPKYDRSRYYDDDSDSESVVDDPTQAYADPFFQ